MEKIFFALSLGFAGLILASHAALAAPSGMPQIALYPSQINLIDTSNKAHVTS